MALLLLGGGCSATQRAARPTSLDDFGRIVQAERDVDVVVDPVPPETALESPPPARLRLLGLSADGISVEASRPRLIQLEDLRGYVVTKRALGASEGAFVGLLAGGAVGALAGYLVGSDPPCDPNEFLGCVFHLTAGDKAAIGGATGAVTGLLTGALIGALVGHTDRYIF